MLAGPRPSFNSGPPSQSMQQQPQAPYPMYPNQFQSPTVPPNFPVNQQQPPILPPNFSGSQHYQAPVSSNHQIQSHPQHHTSNQQPSSSQFPSPSLNYTGPQQSLQAQFSTQQPNLTGMQQPSVGPFSLQPPTHSLTSTGNQQQYQSQASIMPTEINQTFMQQGTITSNQFGAPPTFSNAQFPQPQQQPPPFPNQSSASMSCVPQYQYLGSQPPYNNAPSSSFAPISQSPPATSYSQQPLPLHYPNQPNFYTAPTKSGSQLNGPNAYSGQPPPSGPNTHPAQPLSSGSSSYSGQQPPSGPNTYPGQPPSSGPTQQTYQSQRIDPDMVPNVVQVLEQSQEKIQELFITNAPGSIPPLAATDFVCQDQGSCNPRYIRSTTYTIPYATDMIKQSHIPIALAISPLANLRSDEFEPPVANFGEIGPIRCHRCKAYMCSFMQFIDGGKRFICCFCEAATDGMIENFSLRENSFSPITDTTVPPEYFNHLDHSGRRMDWYQRPELCLGSYEVLATKQYCKDEKWPEPPAFIFMIDVSYNSVRSGLVEYICHILKNELLNYLPRDKDTETSNVRVGFATFDKQIHFYNIKNTLGQPQMMIVSDLEDIFVPLLDGFLGSPLESRSVINSLLDQIPQSFANTQETETILAPVIQSGIQAFKEANCSGKIYVFSTTLPIAVAPGKLSNRDDKKLLGTDKEKTLLAPANNIFTKLGEECAQHGCAVDLFVFPNNYIDLATISEVCRVSGGQTYKFNYFSIENDGERLLDDLKRNFQRATAFDALMRVRTSAGIRPIDFLGNFYMTNATEMIFGTIDSDKSVCVELKHDDKLPVESNTYIQAALLYTSISGQRRLRILTLALTVTSSYTSLYPACDLDTIMNYITKVAVRSIAVSTPKSIRDSIITQSANMLACYRKNCAQSTTAGQLILPETLKLLPVYVTSLIKCDGLTGTQTVTTDDRTLQMHRLMSMNIKGTFAYLYPRVFALHNLEEDKIPPPMIRCSYDRFSETGAYVIENGLVMYIWLGSQLSSTFVQSLFGIQTSSHIQAEKCRIVDLDNPISRNVRALLNLIRNERNSYMKSFVIQQRDSVEPFFKNYLIEDKGFTGGASYVDFLYHLHREIRNILQ
ncbi:unnamed protein product [Rotaria socialis]|uniref:Uncharacterized protein n=1 Tax=Rotaria socialis TaxID=392032 RepID=A0A819XQW2_9BILA|nr:unnamed protein product [Rotaria socialis]